MPLQSQGSLRIIGLAFLARVPRSALSNCMQFAASLHSPCLENAQKIQFLLGPKKVPITAQILQLLETVHGRPGPGAAQPRSAVAIYRGGPLDYGVGKNYTTVFIIPRMCRESDEESERGEMRGTGVTDGTRVTLTCEDGSLG